MYSVKLKYCIIYARYNSTTTTCLYGGTHFAQVQGVFLVGSMKSSPLSPAASPKQISAAWNVSFSYFSEFSVNKSLDVKGEEAIWDWSSFRLIWSSNLQNHRLKTVMLENIDNVTRNSRMPLLLLLDYLFLCYFRKLLLGTSHNFKRQFCFPLPYFKKC